MPESRSSCLIRDPPTQPLVRQRSRNLQVIGVINDAASVGILVIDRGREMVKALGFVFVFMGGFLFCKPTVLM